ncbi:Hypothetical protein I595_2920 [Croceitalea dokdonensis DOKDO 023]|uniref:DoxX family protein n=1 Tax=Croceitalea dokdonensis DOKDO 023 TaxID=1300341 RepID=A0A0P7ASV5_9FLAO|nr:DoxX family membrane protein [Croceitalea dokdonensis]KPM30941.1 Hypothetical protein I595_2920 [Croceitalea dokdonensis DOKDO 023]
MEIYFKENAAESILLIFLAITFLQSGFDKVTDWKGNLSWLTGHFAQSPLKKSVPILLAIVTVTEIIAGILSVMGLVHIILHNNTVFAFYGALVSCIALLMLFFGQRLAKEYVGAQTITVYLVPAVFLLFLVQS